MATAMAIAGLWAIAGPAMVLNLLRTLFALVRLTSIGVAKEIIGKRNVKSFQDSFVHCMQCSISSTENLR